MKRIKEVFLGKTNSSHITTRRQKKMNNQEKESAVESPRSVSVKNGTDGDKIQGEADPSGKPRTEFEEFIEAIKVGVQI